MKVLPEKYSGSGKREKVENMFDSIAGRYDLLNRVLSAGTDRSWRRKTIDTLAEIRPQRILDVATGTADMALEALRLNPSEIIGIDISAGMLDEGRKKIIQRKVDSIIRLQREDSENLSFSDHYFDAVMVAFGVRNFDNLQKGLREMLRVVKPGGKIAVLEFAQPEAAPVKMAYGFYSKYILPFIGEKLSNQRSAYEYLPASVQNFPSGSAFLEEMKNAGYRKVQSTPLTFGIARIYTGIK